MQFGFMPGRSTTDAIYIVQQMQENLTRKKKIFAFVDIEKVFDRVPCSILWWAMRKLGIDEWIFRLVKVMYDGANSRVRLSDCCNARFEATPGVH